MSSRTQTTISSLEPLRATRSRWFGAVLWGALLLSGCKPEGATPLPEPPSVDPGEVQLAMGEVTPLGFESPVTIVGAPGSVTAGSTLFVTNLDSKSLPTAASVGSDGSFELTVEAYAGDEVRLQAVLWDTDATLLRSPPVDFRVEGGPPQALLHVTRLPCLLLEPGLEIDFGTHSRAALSNLTPGEIRLRNDCPQALDLSFDSFRIGGSEASFSVLPPTATRLAPAASVVLQASPDLNPAALTPAYLENTYFFFVTPVGEPITRYPITLRVVVR